MPSVDLPGVLGYPYLQLVKKLLAAATFVGVALFALPPAAAQAATASPLQVVSLGDSFASGTGAGDYQEGTAGTCWRSRNSAAEVTVARLRGTGRQVAFQNVACSGATTASLAATFKGNPPQLDALSPATNVVLLTIGANDLGFATYGGICIQADCAGPTTEAFLARMPAVTQNLVALLSAIEARSPYARVVLSGYGRQLSPDANADSASLDQICSAGVITGQERIDGNRVSSALDSAVRAAVSPARSNGVNVTFVSAYRADGSLSASFAGHSLCQSGASFYRGLDALAPGQEGPEAVLHLNALGQAAMAKLFECEVLGRNRR
jgi:lysophospholipase L1-like esterase